MRPATTRAPTHPHTPGRSRGFTLVEMAVVIVVMALILGSILVPLSTQVEQRQIVDTRRQLEDIKEALIGYTLAQTSPALPCPDKTSGSTTTGLGGANNLVNDGIEDIAATGTCEAPNGEGNLPWATLGIAATDPWGNRYRYRVTLVFAQRAVSPNTTFTLTSQGNLLVCPASTLCGASQALTVLPESENSPVAVILSHGPNGWGAINAATGTINTKPTALSADEAENTNGDAAFVSRPPVAEDPSAGTSREFDDIVTWLSPHTLKHRLVAAGKLP